MIALLLLLACGSGPVLPVPEAPPPPPTVLDDEVYRFCHEAGHGGESALEWCALLESLPEDRCPGLRETCAGAPPVDESMGCGGPVFGDPGRELASGPRRPVRRPSCGEPPDFDLQGLQALVRWVAALAVAIGVLFLFRFLIRWFGWDRRTPVAATTPIPEAVEEDPLEDVPALPSADLLAAARAALAAGDFGEAVLLARGAALRALGEAGRLRLHRSRTDREYVRALRTARELQGWLRAVVRAVERHRWGGRPVDAEVARAALAAAERVLGAAVVLILLWPGLAHAQDAWRYGPFGDAALFDLWDRYGLDVAWRLRGLDALTVDEPVDVVVLDLSGVNPSDADWELLRTWVEAGRVLVVAGDASAPFPELGQWSEIPRGLRLRTHDAWRRADVPDPMLPDGPRAAWQGAAEDGALVRATGTPTGDVEGLPTPDDGLLAPIHVVRIGDGVVVGLADARFLWNGFLVDPVNERFLGDLLLSGQVVDDWPMPSPPRVHLATTAGGGSETPSSSLANAQLIPFVLQFLAFWALLGLWRGIPFAPLRDPPGAGRQRFVDHVRAIARRHRAAGGTRHAASWYARLWVGRLRHGGIRLAAERHGHPPDAAKALADDLDALAENPDGPDDPDDLRLVETLWTITRRR